MSVGCIWCVWCGLCMVWAVCGLCMVWSVQGVGCTWHACGLYITIVLAVHTIKQSQSCDCAITSNHKQSWQANTHKHKHAQARTSTHKHAQLKHAQAIAITETSKLARSCVSPTGRSLWGQIPVVVLWPQQPCFQTSPPRKQILCLELRPRPLCCLEHPHRHLLQPRGRWRDRACVAPPTAPGGCLSIRWWREYQPDRDQLTAQ